MMRSKRTPLPRDKFWKAEVHKDNAVVQERRPDGTTVVRYGPGVGDVESLRGINRTDAPIGTRGRLVYRANGSYGLYWFEPYKE